MRGFISWKKQEKLIIFIRSPRNLSWSLACTRLISSILHVSTCLSTNADSCQFCSRAESLTTSVVLLFRTHDRLNSEVATCKGIRIPQYGKFWHVESRILGKFCCLIRNPGLWNPEYSSRYPQSHYWLESRKTHWQRLESNTWNPESTACNLESETLGDSIKGTQRQFSENICSEDDLRSRIFGTFVVKFLACLPLLGFSNF